MFNSCRSNNKSTISERDWKNSAIKQFDVWEKKKNRHFFNKRYEYIIDFIPQHLRILDVGCGDGEMLSSIIHSKNPSLAVGIDIRKNLVNPNNINIFRADSDYLPFVDNSFDILYCCAVVEHLYDASVTISEMYRVLVNGGLLIITTPNPFYSRLAQIASIFNLKYKEGLEKPKHIGEVASLLKVANFKIISTKGFLLFPFRFPFDRYFESVFGKVISGKTILFNQLIVARKFC